MHVDASARVLIDRHDQLAATALDISEGGAGLNAAAPMKIGLQCAVAVDLPTETGVVRINGWGTVVYCVPATPGFRIGICFFDMDAYSALHVRTLGDPV
ncbi:PilZ domain-containing protein [Herbaspirillum sp. HC18]|nr:PilZ domain-containing protein [Herbaspirillum sp. HC18]